MRDDIGCDVQLHRVRHRGCAPVVPEDARPRDVPPRETFVFTACFGSRGLAPPPRSSVAAALGTVSPSAKGRRAGGPPPATRARASQSTCRTDARRCRARKRRARTAARGMDREFRLDLFFRFPVFLTTFTEVETPSEVVLQRHVTQIEPDRHAIVSALFRANSDVLGAAFAVTGLSVTTRALRSVRPGASARLALRVAPARSPLRVRSVKTMATLEANPWPAGRTASARRPVRPPTCRSGPPSRMSTSSRPSPPRWPRRTPRSTPSRRGSRSPSRRPPPGPSSWTRSSASARS